MGNKKKKEFFKKLNKLKKQRDYLIHWIKNCWEQKYVTPNQNDLDFIGNSSNIQNLQDDIIDDNPNYGNFDDQYVGDNEDEGNQKLSDFISTISEEDGEY